MDIPFCNIKKKKEEEEEEEVKISPRRNPELESLIRQFVVDFNIVLTTPVTAMVPGCMGSGPSRGLHQ